MPVPKGGAADTDELDPDALGVYRTLVVRRSPAAKPAAGRLRARLDRRVLRGLAAPAGPTPPCPSAYRWDRGSTRLPSLGATACCALARGAGALIAAAGNQPGGHPAHRRPWVPGAGRRLRGLAAGLGAPSGRDRSGRRACRRGPAPAQQRRRVHLVRRTRLTAGTHTFELDLGGADLHPGSGGAGPPAGPIVVSRAGPAPPLVRVPARDARKLCGRNGTGSKRRASAPSRARPTRPSAAGTAAAPRAPSGGPG